MNKLAAVVFSTLFAAVAAFGSALSPDDLGCIDARTVKTLEPGKWYLDWKTCKEYADKNGIPVLFIWSNKSCVHCQYTDLVFVQDSFKDWASKNNAGKVIYCFMAGGESKYPDQEKSEAYNWMWYKGGTQLNAFPFVVLWWKAKDINKRYTGDDFCSGSATGEKFNAKTALNEKSMPSRVPNVIAKMESAFKGWNPVQYAGGTFRTGTKYDRLEAEKSTTTVSVDVTRTATEAMSQIYTISASGKTTLQKTLSWAKGVTKKTISIASFNTAWFAAGKAVTLKLYDGTKTTDKVMSTTTITCTTPANSTGNPDFKGCADFGQWTMDLDAAKAKVNGTGGDAWTLVCVQGSLWCPDCGRVEKNFLGAKDASGNNKFTAWAKSKNVALVTVDIPNFSANSSTAASPCLLKKDAYSTDPEASGTKTAHSGLGYLTRKMVSDADAKAMLTRNWELASKMTSEGGFNRPEERDYKSRTFRCGAPIFVLLDKSGKVRAELVRLAEVSPTDTTDFDNYIKRFEEMIDIAKNNATEIENNYASSGSITISASGVEKARLCNADMYDTFKVGGNARQKVVVKGDSSAGFDADCKVTVEFQKLENGKAVTLGTAKSGLLKDGVTQEYTFTSGGTYYVQVRGWGPKTDTESRSAGYNSSAFAATSSKASHFQNYTLTLTTILKPQEDKATYSYEATTGKVSMDLVKGTLYRITGMASCPSQLKDKGGNLYEAKTTATAVITLPESAGTLEYQIWKPGSLGFAQVARTVARSVCDVDGKALPIKVSRAGGKSGAASATVSVDPNGTTIADKNRYWLTLKSNGSAHSDAVEKVDLKWADGDEADKTVYLYIDDDQTWDGFGKVALQIAVTGGEAKIAEGRGAFTLFVLPEVIEAPGKVVLNRADPALASKKVYAEVGTGVKLWLERTEGFDGQVAGILQSSVAGVKFAVANPRDLVRLADSDPKLLEKYGRRYGADAQLLYWASSEGGEKYVEVKGIPAGETAKISFIPIGELKGSKVTATIVSVATDAPRFETDERNLTGLYRYMAVSETIKVLKTTKGGTVQVKKLSGKIPSGVKVAYDEKAKAMTLTGVPTKAGAFESVYQVIETRGGKKVEGLTMQLNMQVRDLVTGEPGGKPVNPSIAKSRTFKVLPVYRTDGDKRTMLVGTLQLTIPQTGKASAKFTGFDGTTSFSAKSWSGLGLGGTLEVTLADKKYGRSLFVEVAKDGSIGAELSGDEKVNGCVVVSDGKTWSKTNPAKDWKGYYTVALKNKGTDFEEKKGIAPTGDGYLTLKMDTDSACNSGTFKVAGKLPNGTAVSCSMVLSREDGEAVLPIFKTASKDTLAAAVVITPNAEEDEVRRCVTSGGLFDGYWLHEDKAGASYAVNFGLYGSYYDKDEDLGGCCAEYFGKKELSFYVEKEDLADIKVGTDTITVTDPGGIKLTCKLARATGIVTGKFTHPGLDKSVSYVGVVVNGWGDECGCGPADVYLPFVSGSYQYTEDGLKRGGVIEINK